MPQLKENDINQIMQEVIDKFLIPKFNELGMSATGRWLESLETEARQNLGVIRGQDYSEFLARGRRPGNRPPIAPIERWVNAKLGISGQQARGVAFAIATKIGNEGTTWYQQGGTDLLEVLESPECVDYVRSRFTGLMQLEVKNSFERMVKEVLA